MKDGYARNYLIPQKIAVEKTVSTLNTLALMQKSLEKKRAKRKLDAVELKEKIANISIELKMKVADGHKLYGSVSQQTILDALKEQGVEVHKKDIHLERHIKELGKYTVEVKLYHDVVANVSISILNEDGELPEEPAVVAVEEAKETVLDSTDVQEDIASSKAEDVEKVEE